MEEEKELGPKELRRLQGEDVGDNSEEDEDIDPIETNRKSAQREAAAMERVRQYQVNRLKYYYAVAVLDCVETAARWENILALQKILCYVYVNISLIALSRVYEECDGMEYELSATRLDLR